MIKDGENGKVVQSIKEGVTDEELNHSVHSTNYCSWVRLKPYLEEAAGFPIKGVRMDDKGLELIKDDKSC